MIRSSIPVHSSLAEMNNDTGKQELLVVKLVLEEWHHWLDGTTQPFLVWDGNKFFEYIWSASHSSTLLSPTAW